MRVLRATVLAVAATLVATLAPSTGAVGALLVPDVATVNGAPVKYVEDQPWYAEAYAVPGGELRYTVDYTGKTPGTYETWLSCVDQENQYAETEVTTDPAVGVVEYTATTPEGPTGCSIHVRKVAPTSISYGRYLKIRMLPPAAEILGFQNPSGSAFYPYVPERPDSWTASFVSSHPARATMVVRTLTGKVVHTSSKWPKSGPTDNDAGWKFGFAWNGRNSTTGNLVTKGTYKVGFVVESTLNDTSDSHGPVNAIATPGRRTITKSVVVAGRSALTSTGGGCRATGQPSGSLSLNCAISPGTSSAFAQARWTFALPASAKIAGWKVSGVLAGDDVPTKGSVRHTLTRLSSTKVRITTGLTGKRSYIVVKVTLTYSYIP